MSASPAKAMVTIDDFAGAIGTRVGQSEWRTVSQAMIDAFAEATDDRQWIHTDPDRAAAETPFGGTIAHGFLTLSLLSTLAFEALPEVEGATMGINYGFDSVRFQAPVKSGARVRALFDLAEADIRPGRRVLATYEVTLEIEGSTKPALTARWVILTMFGR